MGVHRLNHAVLYVRDVERTKEFYGATLGFDVVMEFPGAAFLRAPNSTNDHDLGVFEVGDSAGPSTAGGDTHSGIGISVAVASQPVHRPQPVERPQRVEQGAPLS